MTSRRPLATTKDPDGRSSSYFNPALASLAPHPYRAARHQVEDPGHDELAERFWKRVTEITTRAQCKQGRLIGSDEIRRWNAANLTPCKRCRSSRDGKICSIDSEDVTCRTCRTCKVGCDRKEQFIFDLTKDEFYATYEQFSAVYSSKHPRMLRKERKQENRRRKKIVESATEVLREESTIFFSDGPIQLCASCLRHFEYERARLASEGYMVNRAVINPSYLSEASYQTGIHRICKCLAALNNSSEHADSRPPTKNIGPSDIPGLGTVPGQTA
ncbi:hypothetical protein FB451DRAFT_1221504 [Mycena latifolia]|nr:hypothetical protein FB451DRAFT_1221504 [Mycena latifolia]